MAEGPDDDDFEPPPFFPIMPGAHVFAGSPEDLIRHLQNQQERGEMEANATVHSRLNLLEAMPREVVEYLSHLMGHIVAHEDLDASGVAAYHRGFFAAHAWHKFGVCPACGVNHHEELEATTPSEGTGSHDEETTDGNK